uniref:Kinesin-like protein n=1 Tax=Cajanus cajan TaxID=3821 RepID=A0A151TW91_CAJCA|nr:Kinesin-4 [Cajanus cajan]
MEAEQVLTFSLASVIEDVLQQHSGRLGVNLASRKTEEDSLRRYEAARWLRKTVGVVRGKDLPAEPSEEDFRIGLRSGIILCTVLNKVQPRAVPKVIEGPCDSVIIPDGAALSTYEYFENVRSFLKVVEEMGIPTFEAFDLGGKSSRIVNCVLALKSYAEWKFGGGIGSWKYSGVANAKPPISGKPLLRENSEPLMKPLRTVSSGDIDGYMSDPGLDRNEKGPFSSLNSLVCEYLADKKPEEVPIAVESLLSKVIEEFKHHTRIQHEMVCVFLFSLFSTSYYEEKYNQFELEDSSRQNLILKQQNNQFELEDSSRQNLILKQQNIVEQQNRITSELKNIVHQTKLGMQSMQNEHRKEIIYLSKHMHSLASAASGYQKVLEENRKLYNQVQDLKGNIRVYCRVRPFLGGQPSHYSSVSNVEEGSISIITPSKYGKEGKKTFNFNRAFGPSATQGEVFSDTQPLIRSVLDGYNVCIFAYGQTGSGKTFTMSGPDDLNEETIGVNYHIRNSSHNGINVPDANLVPVSCTSDVINLMNLGHKNRAVGSTAMNDRSSRSHSCLTVHVQGKNLTSGSTIRGSMHLVDLAGSERADKTEATGDRLKEAQHINKSLSALGDVISSLAQKNAHVPYRNSKLTQLLQDSLGGQAKTLMFVHISPEPEALGETLSTLKFAERVSTVELGAARVNKDNSDVKELKEQIASLKAALARKEGEAENSQQSINSSSNEIPKLKSYASSPIQRSWTSGPHPYNILKGLKNTASTLKRRSLDLHDMRRDSSPWPNVSRGLGKEDDKESISGDSVDKIFMNRNDSMTSEDGLMGPWEAESKQSSPMLSPTYLTEPSKICMDQQPLHKKDNKDDEDLPKQGLDTATTEELDGNETETSESSELDLHWPSHIPKPIIGSSGLGIRAKKSSNIRPSLKNPPEVRSMIPSFIPVPTPKKPTPITQARKPPGSNDIRRRITK